MMFKKLRETYASLFQSQKPPHVQTTTWSYLLEIDTEKQTTALKRMTPGQQIETTPFIPDSDFDVAWVFAMLKLSVLALEETHAGSREYFKMLKNKPKEKK